MAEDIRQLAMKAYREAAKFSFTRAKPYVHPVDYILAAVRPVLLAEGYRQCQKDAERAIEAATAHSSIRWPVALALTAVRSLAPANQPETTSG